MVDEIEFEIGRVGSRHLNKEISNITVYVSDKYNIQQK
jgi:hypothetical protein